MTKPLLLAAILGSSLAAALPAQAQTNAVPTATPTVVEMFTSKYCPNCPMAESKLRDVAEEHPDTLVVFEHVDYWDAPDAKDPLGLPEITQRQYDYSNTLGKRPGEVYTPMPVLNGHIVAKPPLFLSWGSALAKAQEEHPAPLALKKEKDGALTVTIPATLKNPDNEVWVLGLQADGAHKTYNVTGIAKGNVKADGTTAHVTAPLLPKAAKLLVLLQKPSPNQVLAVGVLN